MAPLLNSQTKSSSDYFIDEIVVFQGQELGVWFWAGKEDSLSGMEQICFVQSSRNHHLISLKPGKLVWADHFLLSYVNQPLVCINR